MMREKKTCQCLPPKNASVWCVCVAISGKKRMRLDRVVRRMPLRLGYLEVDKCPEWGMSSWMHADEWACACSCISECVWTGLAVAAEVPCGSFVLVRIKYGKTVSQHFCVAERNRPININKCVGSCPIRVNEESFLFSSVQLFSISMVAKMRVELCHSQTHTKQKKTPSKKHDQAEIVHFHSQS